MAIVKTDNKHYVEIAEAIRAVNGLSKLYAPAQMAAAILALGSSNRLPEGYTELAYIESTGTQYIDTGFVPNQNTRVLVTFETETCNNDYRAVFAARTTSGNKDSVGFYLSNANVFTGFYGNATSFSFSGIDFAGNHIVDWNKNVVTLDGVTQTLTAQTFNSGCPLFLCAVDNAGTVFNKHFLHGKIYSCQIYDNSTLVRDFVPCRNPYGDVGLYDLVNAQFYGNAGTSTFVGNVPVVRPTLPIGYTELSYIQSSGTQYIDTGFKMNQDSRVVMKVQPTVEPSSYGWLFEGRDTGGKASKGVIYFNGDWCADYNVALAATRYHFTTVSPLDVLNIDYNKNSCTINGETGTFAAETFQSTTNLALLALNTSGTVNYFVSAKLYSSRVYDNGVLIRDFVPCRNPNGEYGLYDLVNAKFYGNAGTGSFTGS